MVLLSCSHHRQVSSKGRLGTSGWSFSRSRRGPRVAETTAKPPTKPQDHGGTTRKQLQNQGKHMKTSKYL